MPAPIGRLVRVRTRRSDEGAAAVEFALVSVLLFALLFGTLQYGLFFFQAGLAQDALRTAARQVETGTVPECTATWGGTQWAAQLKAASSNVNVTDVGWLPDTAVPVERHASVTVSLTWEPTRIAGGLIPFPAGARTVTRPLVVVDSVGTNLDWSSGSGCPL